MPIEPAPSHTRKYTTISIPTPLFQQVEKKIEGTGFRSATEFIVYVTRVAITDEGAPLGVDLGNRLKRSMESTGGGREEMTLR